MALRLRKKAPALAGLDLDPAHLAAAEVHVNGVATVQRGVVAPLAPGVLRDGEVADSAALTEAVRALWDGSGLPSRVRLGIANQRVVVRTLHLPVLEDPRAVAAAVEAEAPTHIPIPVGEAVLDHQSLGVVATPGGPRLRVVVVAVRREMVERVAYAVRGAGLEVAGIDLSAFALVRCLADPAADAGEGVLYVSPAGLTNVAVAHGADCLFTRASAGGLDAIVQTLADGRGLTLEHAGQWLRHVGLERPVEAMEGDPEVVAAARAALVAGVHELADVVRNTLNFYRAQQDEAVRRCVLSGPATAIDGFAAALSESLDLPVKPRVVARAEGVDAPAPSLAIAAGLAREA